MRHPFSDELAWDEPGIGRVDKHLPFLEMDVRFIFFTQETDPPGISEKMHQTMLDVLALTENDENKLKELLWEEAVFSFTVADYGCEPRDGESHLDAHMREFECANREDTYRQCTVQEVQFDAESDELRNRFAIIVIETVANNLIDVIVKNGRIVDFDDSGTFLGFFEEADDYAAQKRRMTLTGD